MRRTSASRRRARCFGDKGGTRMHRARSLGVLVALLTAACDSRPLTTNTDGGGADLGGGGPSCTLLLPGTYTLDGVITTDGHLAVHGAGDDVGILALSGGALAPLVSRAGQYAWTAGSGIF